MGIALEVFQLVRFSAAGGCRHHLLARAGRPSYPNHDQAAEDAADDLAEVTLATLVQWSARWWLPTQCRAREHRATVVGETDAEGLVHPDDDPGAPDEIDLADDVGMRTVDLWVTGRSHDRIALGLGRDAGTFWAAVAADPPEDADSFARPGEGVRALFLTDRSGAGDLRNV